MSIVSLSYMNNRIYLVFLEVSTGAGRSEFAAGEAPTVPGAGGEFPLESKSLPL